MIPAPSGVKVRLATRYTDMRKSFPGLALMEQETLKRDPMGGHLFVFRGRGRQLIFDKGYCGGMTLGALEISIGGLNELAVLLERREIKVQRIPLSWSSSSILAVRTGGQ